LRGVLLSPLLVLILYLAFRSPHPAASSASRGYYRQYPAASMHALTRTLRDPQPLQPLQAVQQPVLMQASYTTAGDGGEEAPAWVVVAPPPAEGQQEPPIMAASTNAASASMLDASSTIVRPRPQPKRLVSNYYSPLVAAPQHLVRDAKNHQHQNHRIVVQPSHLRRDEEPQLLLAPQQQQPMQMQMQMAAQPMQAVEGDGSEPVSLALQQQQQPYMGSSAGAVGPESAPIVLRAPMPLQAGEPAAGGQDLLPDALVSAPLQQDAPVQQDAVMQQQQPQLAMARRGKNSGAQNRRRGGDSGGASASSTVVYYYYDPRDVPTDPRTGRIAGNRLPPIVYDPSGNPHWLSSIRAKEILLEAPPLGQASSPAVQAAAAAAPPGNVAPAEANPVGSAWTSAAMVQAGGGSGGSGSSGPIPQWGESTATDQSIIVCTVGIMALLVGAVSARRFRRQSFLSACIENEALDSQHGDDAALPYGTGGPADGGASSSYRTFEGWKGDLEKFDV
jgi:hypothetical protein